MKLFGFWLGYCALLAALVLGLQRCDGEVEPGLVATRDLKLNQRLQDGDVAVKGHGLYIGKKIDKGKPVEPADLVRWPRVKAGRGMLVVALPVLKSPAGAATVNAGEAVSLCPPGDGAPQRLTTLAVLCGPGTNECIGLIELGAPDAAKFAGAQAKGRGLMLAASCPPPGR